MRHRVDHRKLSRTSSHRKALLRNLVTALFLHDRIETTLAKAKEARRLAERLITYAKRNNLHSRRLVAAVVNDRAVVTKIFETIAPLYATRDGGYTRVLKTRRRLGDAGEVGILELVKTKEQKDAERKRHAEAAEAEKPKKKGLFSGRKKSAEPSAEAAGAEKAGKEKKTKPEAKEGAPAKAKETAPAKERKAKPKAEGGGKPRSKGAPTPGGKAPRKSRGSQRGQ